VLAPASRHGAVRITYPTSEVDGRVHRYWAILALIGVVVLTAATVVGLRFARAVAGPLGRLEAAARQAGAGDLDVRAPVEGPPEVRSLARSFNEMVAKLDELVRSQREFVADASHQLRTPLAALRLRLENLEYEISPDGGEGLSAALAEVGRLSRLTDGPASRGGFGATRADRSTSRAWSPSEGRSGRISPRPARSPSTPRSLPGARRWRRQAVSSRSSTI
jgi:signal transduction histidine kinase